MDNPPSTYNPNESVLSGGINSSTPITMVQGGGGVLDGYNETTSVLEGGINSSTPITMIQGGGNDNNIQIVSNYNFLDLKQYESFIQRFSSTNRFTNAAKKLEDMFNKKYTEKSLHYRKSASYVESNSLNSRNTTNLIQIKFVPLSTKTLIILPPISEAKEFVNQIMFLINNQYLSIDSKQNFILERNVFVISLAPFDSSDISKYFYYKLKLSNLYSYYRIDDPYVFIVRKEIDGKKGILIAKSGFIFLKPSNKDELTPIDYDLIKEDDIQTMKYKGDISNIYDNFYMIADGEDPESPIISDYTFTLKSNIAVLDLIEEDIQKIKVDIQGKSYRIRMPLTPNQSLDKVYNDWMNNKYEGDERKLIDELHLEDIRDLEIPRFLFHLSYFKCFDDTSLLTRSECSYMKNELQQIYLHSLKKRKTKLDMLDSTVDLDNRVFDSYDCNAIDASTDNEKVICTVAYKTGLVDNKTNVKIDKKFISILKSNKPEDIDSIRDAVETEFRKQQ